MRWVKGIVWLLAFAVLTILTQVGGVALLLSTILTRFFPAGMRRTGWRRRATGFSLFLAVYAVITLVLVPPLAQLGGRAPLQCFPTAERPYGALSVLYCASNRHYARASVHTLMDALAGEMAGRFPGTDVRYLDANLPFFDGFPLIPHVTHSDGLKIDIAFFYQDEAGTYQPGLARWPVGYWSFEQPAEGDRQPCAGMTQQSVSLRWDMEWLQPLLPDLPVDAARSGHMARWLVEHGPAYGLRRMLLEPHLADRWAVSGGPLGFQGCRAGRHDDHIHLSLRGR